MKKWLLLLVAFSVAAMGCDEWTRTKWAWMTGANIRNQPGIYGTRGVPAAANTPGARYRAVSWTDPDGNLWLFGGYGYASSGSAGRLNDLWRYQPATGNWTWMKGPNTSDNLGTYGTKGVPAVANKPGARHNAVSWTDPEGSLWLFGGWGYDKNGTGGYLNDLWRYQPATGNWTWMKGSDTGGQKGTYGTKGVPSAANTPGGRSAAVSWTDSAGNFWLFGGDGLDKTDFTGRLNDLWRYQPATGNWTWMNGADAKNQLGIYGTIGVPAAANTPGGRFAAVSWTDSAGSFWLFGGNGYGSAGDHGRLNDLWRYQPATGRWTWMKGADIKNQPGTYGSRGVSAAANTPGARDNSVSCTDNAGNLWLFGGFGRADSTVEGYIQDAWKLNPYTANWTWCGGSNQLNQKGVYGTKGVPASNNYPGARYIADSWADNSGALWLFGGQGYDKDGNFGYLNDLWRNKLAPFVSWSLPAGAAKIGSDNFDTYILIANPSNQTANVRARFVGSSGFIVATNPNIPPNSRLTLKTGNFVAYTHPSASSVSVIVESHHLLDTPIHVERAMYWGGAPGSWRDGHDTIGIDVPADEWNLPEGATHIFDMFVHVLNPGNDTVRALVVFMNEEGQMWQTSAGVAAGANWTIKVNNIVGSQDQLSTKVTSYGGPVAVDRTMYLPKGDWRLGHCSRGVSTPSTTWYLAEGANHFFDHYVLVSNPSSNETANVTFTFRDQHGNTAIHQQAVGPRRRYTVKVNDHSPGLSQDQVSTRVESTNAVPVFAERAMYWPRGGPSVWKGGHDTIGAAATALKWYLPEGANHLFDHYVLVFNPGSSQNAQVKITFLDQYGSIHVYNQTIGPGSRYTVKANNIPGWETKTQVSTVVESTNGVPVIAERAMYWPKGAAGGNWTGGHVTVGIAEP